MKKILVLLLIGSLGLAYSKEPVYQPVPGPSPELGFSKYLYQDDLQLQKQKALEEAVNSNIKATVKVSESPPKIKEKPNYTITPPEVIIEKQETNKQTGIIKTTVTKMIPVPVEKEVTFLVIVRIIFRILLVASLVVVLTYAGFKLYNEIQIFKSIKEAKTVLNKTAEEYKPTVNENSPEVKEEANKESTIEQIIIPRK